MPHQITSHEVENFDSWYESFKQGEANRSKHGIRVNGVYRGDENPNHITIHSEADSHENYERMAADPEFHELMRRYGVKSQPQMHRMNKVD